jgi:hypothetical protein
VLFTEQSSDEENKETSAVISKCQNAGKSYSGIGISSGSQLLQSGMGIPASGFSPVPLVTDKSGIAQLWCSHIPNLKQNMLGIIYHKGSREN